MCVRSCVSVSLHTCTLVVLFVCEGGFVYRCILVNEFVHRWVKVCLYIYKFGIIVDICM